MIKRPGHIKKLDTPKDIAELDRQIDELYVQSNYSTGGVPGGGGSPGPVAISIWSTSTRPAMPAFGTFGYNTDFNGTEVYTPLGWYVINGIWTTAQRPTGVVTGSRGFNSTIPSQEYWDGSQWNQG